MADQLLVRTYDVGLGDCIYVGIPNGNERFHVLIDCGTKGKGTLLKNAIRHMKENLLPDSDKPGKKRLDLLVATHRHADHIKGLDPDEFVDIDVRAIWLSAVMNPKHPQAKGTHHLHGFAAAAMRGLDSQALSSLSPQLLDMAQLYGIDNDGAMDAVREVLPKRSKIDPTYVHAGMTSKNGASKLTSLASATIRVLGPEENIDFYYLGDETQASLRTLEEENQAFLKRAPAKGAAPQNISASDFRLLQSRMLSNALSFAEKDSSIQNNASVVLLIEWSGRRLLFVGDAEWHGEYKEGKHNGSWNVMWHRQKVHLNKAIDFLKVGHHGSMNATPRHKDKPASYEVNKILDAILPVSRRRKAKAVVSTLRTNVYESIPASDMLVELGRRVSNRRKYKTSLAKPLKDAGKKLTDLPHYKAREQEFIGKFQPHRTDFEALITPKRIYVDAKIDPA